MDFIKKHKFLSAILFLTPVLILILLHVLDALSSLDIQASEWITLTAGLLTYYGTVILAIVTSEQNDKLIEFQERQEERDKIQQQIAREQLEIAERQKEIADRQLKFIKREQEINEISLIYKNQPNFEITSLMKATNREWIPVELRKCVYINGYDHEFDACTNIEQEEASITLYVVFDNKSETDAYDVSIAEVDPILQLAKDETDFESNSNGWRENKYYANLSITKFECVPSGEGKVQTFVLSKNENRYTIDFTLTYKNAYGHWFFQDVEVCITREENIIKCQLLINDSRQGEKDVNEHGIVQYENGTFLQFPPRKEAVQ